MLLQAPVLKPITARASRRDVLLAEAEMEGRAQYPSARWNLCPLLHPSGSFSEAQAKTLLPAELYGATELWKLQPDTLAGKTSSH